MFERYTESARRALFFARYEVSQKGGLSIEPEHLLLGLTRPGSPLVTRILALSRISSNDLRTEIEQRFESRERIPTSAEIPFSIETKRVLQFAAEEADRLGHRYIGTEHLFLGVLREDTSNAASLLKQHGLRLDDVRSTVVKLLAESPLSSATSTHAALPEQIAQIKLLVQQLADAAPGSSDAGELTERIERQLDAFERYFH
jgi:ATP-dependent Clp protease ATP-binding subunit ClpC